MTARDKAKTIYKLYSELVKDHTKGVTIKPLAKECGLIAVDEILSVIWLNEKDVAYWQEVKQHINEL